MKEEKISLNNFKVIDIGIVYKEKEILSNKLFAMKVMNKNTIIKKKYFHFLISEYEILKYLSFYFRYILLFSKYKLFIYDNRFILQW